MLWPRLLATAERFPDRPAVEAGADRLTYAELVARAKAIASAVRGLPTEQLDRVAVVGGKVPDTYAAIAGILLSGAGYVPLNPTFPIERNTAMVEAAGCKILIAEASQLDLARRIAERVTGLTILDLAEPMPDTAAWTQSALAEDALAYILFTSGSTGKPKGVAVAQRNVTAFIDAILPFYDLNEADRFSQVFDFTFDLSAFDIFIAWQVGGTICCPGRKDNLRPDRYIRDNGLTVWFSVPSTAIFCKQAGILKPDAFPGLRLSLFCGEPLPASVAEAWGVAAPNAPVENLYGPTELTIAFTRYRVDPATLSDLAENGIVPIGAALPEMRIKVVDESGAEVGPGEVGELIATGPQLTLGYWQDPERTQAAFFVPEGETETFYRTGDRVRSAAGDRPMTHLGRLDGQIKVRGYRVELGEIEAAVRNASGRDGVVALGWPRSESAFGGIEVFVQGQELGAEVVERLSATLPDYMRPRRIHYLDALPVNANGKFDRNALTRMLEAMG
ncbi:MAG TPA: amino acid adenylation domain-containing protein [Sphingomonas sp.]|nr:amino acid adenylation domain-containing protein [Sphingomonas sp.]